MRNWICLFWLLAVMLLSACQPADSYQGRVILDGSHQPGKDEVVPGDLLVVDGEAALDQGSRVDVSLQVLANSARWAFGNFSGICNSEDVLVTF
ncbi:MAG: hypothetical protein U5K99_07440 [Anaerolineales bacterium]|nr:hypothetical protein [Anaerolineales bacterium]